MSVRSSLLTLALLFAVSCGASIEEPLATIVEVKPSGWYTPAEITFEVSDTTSLFDMQIMLRYDRFISDDHVELLVSTTAPDSVVWSEEFTISIPSSDHPLQIVEQNFRESIMWGQVGEYRVSLHPMHTYKGISSVGVRIINSQ